MGAPYSYDLRTRVMAQYQQGVKPTTVCKNFSITRDTFYRWKRRQEETGDVKPVTDPLPCGPRHKIKDFEAFRVWVDQQTDQRLSHLAATWSTRVSASTICRTLKKIGYTHKKSPTFTKSVTKP